MLVLSTSGDVGHYDGLFSYAPISVVEPKPRFLSRINRGAATLNGAGGQVNVLKVVL